jgi:hypothetical protein
MYIHIVQGSETPILTIPGSVPDDFHLATLHTLENFIYSGVYDKQALEAYGIRTEQNGTAYVALFSLVPPFLVKSKCVSSFNFCRIHFVLF